MTIDEMIDALTSYRDYTVTIDREIAESELCEKCAQQMEYVGARRAGSYRAFAVCRACNRAEEF
jgi:hypothetical protein